MQKTKPEVTKVIPLVKNSGKSTKCFFQSPLEIIESAHEKTYNKTCATSEDSDQPAHPRSLIRVFADRKCILQPPGYPKRDKREPLPLSLRKHAYSNILKISPPKTEIFQIKKSDIFHISAQNIYSRYSFEPPQ